MFIRLRSIEDFANRIIESLRFLNLPLGFVDISRDDNPVFSNLDCDHRFGNGDFWRNLCFYSLFVDMSGNNAPNYGLHSLVRKQILGLCEDRFDCSFEAPVTERLDNDLDLIAGINNRVCFPYRVRETYECRCECICVDLLPRGFEVEDKPIDFTANF